MSACIVHACVDACMRGFAIFRRFAEVISVSGYANGV